MAISKFDFFEAFSGTIGASQKSWGRFCSLSVDPQLQNRRIYCYMALLQSAPAQFFLDGKIELLRNGRTIGAGLPAAIADNVQASPAGTITRPVSNLFTAGGVAKDGSIQVYFKTIINGQYNALLHPFDVRAEADEINFNVTGLSGGNILAFDVYLGCLSIGD